jgi:hypothetical protein
MSEIPVKQLRNFVRACRLLNSTILEIRRYEPNARYYLEGGTMHLMSSPSHDPQTGAALQDNVLESERLKFSDGGSW